MRPLYLRANGLNTLTSKNARWPVAHTPLALMSSLASADVLAVLGIRVSPDKGTSAGSTHTSLHTSLRRLAEMFLNSLCLEETNPPFLHEKAWLRSKLSPKTHFDGVRERGQLNLKFRASQNSCLVSTWPLSSEASLSANWMIQIHGLFR